MKAIFFNVPVKLRIAMQDAIEKALPNSQYEVSEGNVQWYQHINPNQRVDFLHCDLVVVEGERCALWGDHYALALKMLQDSGIKPTLYETSNHCLKWHETLASYMENRASYEEALKHCRKTQGNPHYYKALRGLALQAERLERYPARVHAELTISQLNKVREVLSLI